MRWAVRIGCCVAAAVLGNAACGAATVPVISCAADGQSGPIPAPVVLPAPHHVRAAVAGRLSFYDSATSLAVLAPRGWHCLAAYGSGGAFLLVTPRLYATDRPPGFGSVGGPAVELSFLKSENSGLNGENSGREDVAAVFARLFPARDILEAASADPDLRSR